MYGWEDFDQDVVAELGKPGIRPRVNDAEGMLCPLVGHDAHWLPWEKTRRGGTALHGAPPARFRASPTFIFSDPRENVITGKHLIDQLITKGKAETRIKHENSEDALSWNVFRSLQDAELLGAAATVLAGVQPESEPELFMWSVQVERDQLRCWPQLREVRDRLEPRRGQQTEPDVCLHIDGWGWVFIEAKFGSGTTLCADDDALKNWKTHYPPLARDLFNTEAVQGAKRRCLPEQLLRNVLFAHHIHRPGEHAVVISLTRDRDTNPTGMAQRLLSSTTTVPLHHGTWESIYRELCLKHDSLRPLRSYYEHKSLRLQPAFELQGGEPGDAGPAPYRVA